MKSEPIVPDNTRGSGIRGPGVSRDCRERLDAGGQQGKEMGLVARVRWGRFGSRAIVMLELAVLLLPAGCGSEEEQVIEVAILYWGQVRTAAGAPVTGRTVYFMALRAAPDGSYETSTIQTRSGETMSDGRTYLDARFLLSAGQTIGLAASTTPFSSINDPRTCDLRWIFFDEAHDRAEAQGGNDLASFELTAECVE